MSNQEFVANMRHIIEAMKEKGCDPYTQLTGYVMENESTYITNHRGARQLITTLDIECVKQFVKEMR